MKSIKKFLQKNKTSMQKLAIFAGLFVLSVHAFGADDLLDGTTDSLVATLNGSGKIYLYFAEGIISLAAYIKTKNLLFLAGIVVVSIFFNVLMTVAGVS